MTHPGKHQVRVPTVAAMADVVLTMAIVMCCMEGHAIIGTVLLTWTAVKVLVPLLAADPDRVRLGLV